MCRTLTRTILKMCLAILLFCEAISIDDFESSKDFDNYGPYDLLFSRYDVCIGPNVANITSCSIKLITEVNNYVAYVDCTFFALARIDEVKVYTVKDNRTRVLWSYKLNNPCQNYAVAELIKKNLNADNCVVRQGNYSRTLNLTEISSLYFGSSFFYGEYMMKSTMYSKKRNILCVVMNMIFSKKKTL